ncbi:uncharacterized protein LOC122531226 isoform X2 [Frieseomelitta varia]|uniref:uncharacterized protein LOC122531226 isoform X2 n=1 Tax=Frieseomelitta varia TaxID=561572 RepID=UPI001CB67C3F|nr:uncharacterized protein LOC122531226 isoform X2 [Frieseomelitta varia]
MTEREEEERVEKIEKFREASSSRKEVEEFPRERWTSPKLRQRLFKNWLHREISQTSECNGLYSRRKKKNYENYGIWN